jgi:hypothetical protein
MVTLSLSESQARIILESLELRRETSSKFADKIELQGNEPLARRLRQTETRCMEVSAHISAALHESFKKT